MIKGVSIKFKSYEQTIPTLLDITKLETQLQKYDSIVLKPTLHTNAETSTPAAFTEAVLKFCLDHKKQGSQVVIAEGADGEDTWDLFEQYGYTKLAEQYSIGLVDLNTAETQAMVNDNFLAFDTVHYPSLLLNSFVIVLPKLALHPEHDIAGALSSMLGAYPATKYSGWFSTKKSKLRQEPIKNAIHDSICCKMPELAILDASEKGVMLVGHPLEMDKQAARLLKGDWKGVQHLRLIEDSIVPELLRKAQKEQKEKLLEQAEAQQ